MLRAVQYQSFSRFLAFLIGQLRQSAWHVSLLRNVFGNGWRWSHCRAKTTMDCFSPPTGMDWSKPCYESHHDWNTTAAGAVFKHEIWVPIIPIINVSMLDKRAYMHCTVTLGWVKFCLGKCVFVAWFWKLSSRGEDGSWRNNFNKALIALGRTCFI